MTEHYTPTAQRDAAAPRVGWLPQSDTFWVVAPLLAIPLAARLARYWLGCSFVAGFLAGGYLACAVAAVGVLLLEIL